VAPQPGLVAAVFASVQMIGLPKRQRVMMAPCQARYDVALVASQSGQVAGSFGSTQMIKGEVARMAPRQARQEIALVVSQMGQVAAAFAVSSLDLACQPQTPETHENQS